MLAGNKINLSALATNINNGLQATGHKDKVCHILIVSKYTITEVTQTLLPDTSRYVSARKLPIGGNAVREFEATEKRLRLTNVVI
jgi:hypothetical protein